MTTTELIHRVVRIRRLYNQGWTWHDLQCEIEEIFYGLGPEDDVAEDPELPNRRGQLYREVDVTEEDWKKIQAMAKTEWEKVAFELDLNHQVEAYPLGKCIHCGDSDLVPGEREWSWCHVLVARAIEQAALEARIDELHHATGTYWDQEDTLGDVARTRLNDLRARLAELKAGK